MFFQEQLQFSKAVTLLPRR